MLFDGQLLCYISKILKNESNSQQMDSLSFGADGCVISQRYLKMKAIHNAVELLTTKMEAVLYLKDT